MSARDDRPSILDVCTAQRWPLPISHADGVAFFQACRLVGIATNVDDCAMAREAAGAPCEFAEADGGHGTPHTWTDVRVIVVGGGAR